MQGPIVDRAMDRRTWIRGVIAGASASFLASCSSNQATMRLAGPRRPVRYFAPVRAALERVTRTVVGLRPYRPGGFVVRADRFDDRVVIHDYGHGGGGVTLSWGTAHLAVRQALATGDRRFAVVGCGAVGLATAILLQRRGADVTIYAKALPPDTTSNIAGAQWSPFSVYDEAAATPGFLASFAEASSLAYREFQKLLGPRYGVRWIDNFYLSDQPSNVPPPVRELPDVFTDVEELSPDRHPFAARYVTRVNTMFIEPNVYLPALIYDFRVMGGRIVVREFTSLADLLTLDERVVLNCTGLGSRDLFGDTAMIPLKGQLSILPAQPEVDYLMLSGGLYMFPRSDGILLGGTFERNEWSLEPDQAAIRRIVAGHARIFSALE